MVEHIRVIVKLFAAYQEAYGVSEFTLDLPPATPVQHVLDHVLATHPELESWRGLTRLAINLNFAAPATPLQDGDEVVLIPPVSGG